MKYNININQFVLSRTGLDLVDGAILDYIYFYCNSQNPKIEAKRIKDENGIWTWINYSTLLKDMPLLRIKSAGALSPRIQNIEREGYFSTKRFGHQKLFIKMNSKADELFIEMNRAIHQNEQSYSPKRMNNNTKDNNTKDKTNSLIAGNEINRLIDLFKTINPSYERLFSNKTQRLALERLVKKYGSKNIEKLIKMLPEINQAEFAPTIFTPSQLESKLGNLLFYLKKKKPKMAIIR